MHKMSLYNKLTIVGIFAIAMGFLETVVVVYLRELLYPGGFTFPLVPIPESLALSEILREAATLIMLISIGFLAGRSFSSGFAWFIYSFAIWDIFYYVFLKLLIGWPESLLTWDILFLIPTTWTGPVIAPVIVSLSMILLAFIILSNDEKGMDTRLRGKEWGLLIGGSLVLVFGFILDYSRYMLKHFSILSLFDMKDKEVMKMAFSYVPLRFPWGVFIGGMFIIIAGILILHLRLRKNRF